MGQPKLLLIFYSSLFLIFCLILLIDCHLFFSQSNVENWENIPTFDLGNPQQLSFLKYQPMPQKNLECAHALMREFNYFFILHSSF